MIGNLAHDLKTPLTSFITGIDLLAGNLSTIEENMMKITAAHRQEEEEDHNNKNENENNAASLSTSSLIAPMKEAMNCARECFVNIHNTNLFMLMTINRCIDYTKASKGLKLTPKYETIGLLDTLQLPLECMKNIQARIAIEMLAVDSTKICSHIITDKQWLQENILCLLSNAVKYSAEGSVFCVSLTLVTRKVLLKL